MTALDRLNELEPDFVKLLYAALHINDHLRLHVGHATFEGSMNDVELFRGLVNALHHKHRAVCRKVSP